MMQLPLNHSFGICFLLMNYEQRQKMYEWEQQLYQCNKQLAANNGRENH